MPATRLKNIFGTATFCTAQGARSYQEDCYVYKEFPIGYLMAVFDGHVGVHTADIASRNLPRVFDSEFNLLLSKKNEMPIDYEVLLKKVVARLDELVIDEECSGSTISLVFIPKIFINEDPTAYVAVIGDSPIVIANSSDKNIFIGPNHNVRENIKEREAAIKRGGFYDGNYIWNATRTTGLQMGRDLGSQRFGKILSHKPEMAQVRLDNESIIIVATDGVFDPAHRADTRTQAKRLIDMIKAGSDAEDLVKDAL
ncbi:MAG: PP2C family serine/threonine-protein phosphatase, partial [bacterium]|nr:PP2C family serine/threonine-protein phosphatase [bacterium]